MRNIPPQTRVLDAWSPGYAAVRGEERTFGSGAFLEETGQRVYSLASVFTLSFLHHDVMWSASFLLQPPSAVPSPSL